MPSFRPADAGRAIYYRGLSGDVPAFPMTFEGWETAARERLTPEAFAYIAGGAGGEHTMRANRAAFDAYRIVPRMLRGSLARDWSTTVIGRRVPSPLFAAPLGVLGLVHPDAELAVARATASLGVINVVSTAASHTMEEIAQAAPGGARWFQLYWPNDLELAESLVRRAEAAGYGAIVVTLDTWTLGWRPRDLAHAHLPFLRGSGIANYLTDATFRARLRRPPEESHEALAEAVVRWAGIFGHPALSWDDVARVRDWTSLPVVVKGILHPDDARAALAAGVDAIVVSNHGGRQVDRATAALDALAIIAPLVRERAGVLFDSGVRCGADAVVAIALGAHAVLIGRPYAYGLALGGEEGVAHVFRCLLADFDASLVLAGAGSVAEADRSLLGG